MMNDAWQAANKVIEKLEENGFEAVIVGGAVRDFLLNKKANDVDVATSALPQQVKENFGKTIDIGIEHGTVLVLGYEEPIEVTTFRTEGTYTDHRRPDEVMFVRSLAEDLKRRDFTINAMAIRMNGELVDYYGGQEDLQKGILKAVGDANARFTEDALRIVRGIRFSAQLNFSIEEKTALAMTETAAYLKEIAVERIKVEFDKIFVSSSVANAFKHINELALAPHLKGDFDFEQAWSSFKQTNNSAVAWAYWCELMQSNELMTLYKCSNNEKFFVKQTRECYRILTNGNPTRMQLFQLDEVYWLAALHYYEAYNLQEHPLVNDLLVAKKNLPIAAVHELAVSGRDLMAWTNQKGGSWLKADLQMLLQHVVEGNLVNEINTIKEWYESLNE